VRKLSVETPAELVCFDLLAEGDESLLGMPFGQRRARLERRWATSHRQTRSTSRGSRPTRAIARDWFERFEGAGLDGVVAKPLDAAYAPGKRTMLKVKHKRTADAVVFGYRVHTSGQGVGSLLLGLYGDWNGERHLIPVGGIAAFPMATRRALIDEFAPLVVLDDEGQARQCGNRAVTLLVQQGQLLRAGAPRTGRRGGLRPDGGTPVPARRDVPALATRP
jgi:ATP-dependent DNA ligase